MKKVTIIYCLALSLLLLSGCIKDKYTNYYAYLINNSTVDIILLPYKSGFVKESDTIKLENGGKIKIAEDSHIGEINTPFFASEFLEIGENDSIKVIFNDTNSINHFIITPDGYEEKCYSFENDRNLINRENYEFEMIRTKKERINNHYYTFTEEDYEFAKE